jgi:HAE1 family hydrophobic/amphiphilic exporter-1
VTRPDEGQVGRLTRFSLDRRITILVLLLTTLVVGAVASLRMPLELIPRGFQEPSLGIRVPWQDAPAPEVLEKIALPLEEEISGIRGLSVLRSFSRTGSCSVRVRFRQGTDMDIAYREVRDRVERARARFPADADRVFYHKDDETGIPVAVIGLAVDPNLSDPYNLIQKEIILPLQRIDGVASVRAEGLEEKEILIELERARVEGSGLNIYDLARDLAGDNFSMASGTVRDASRKLLLRSMARYRSLEEIENRRLSPSVRLKDVAAVRYDEPEKRYRVRVNSRPAYAMVVMKEGQANTMEVSRRINAAIEEAKRNPRLQSVLMVSLFNQGDVIGESLSTLLKSGWLGGALAGVVLFVFLRRFRMTAIIALSIPLSLLMGLIAMFFAGESLNILSLLGLMICVGMLVDNSIVVGENIHRFHRGGAPLREACVQGAGEIALAITLATLTTILVFLPASLVEGEGRFFLVRLAWPITASLLASLVVALVFVPLAVFLVLPARAGQPHDGWFWRFHDRLNHVLRVGYEATLGRVNHVYTRLTGWCLAHRLDVALVLLAAFGLTFGVAFRHVKFTDVQEEERGSFSIGVELPQSTMFEESVAWFDEAEKVLEAKKDELGLEGYFLFHRATYGEVEGWFTNPRTKEVTPREATRIVKEALPLKPGMVLYTGQESEANDEKRDSTHVLTLHGEDYESLEQVAKGLEEFLVKVPGVLGVKKGADRAPEEIALVVDRDGAQRYGVNPDAIAGVVGYALRGGSLPRYHDEGREIPVRVRFREEDRRHLADLENFAVPAAGGQVLPLSSVTDAEVVTSFRQIFRENKRIARQITLELEEGKEEEARERLFAVTAGLDLPEGIAFGEGRLPEGMSEDQKALFFALGVSVLFIYLLMGFLFESFILPLSILLTIPLGAIGVAWVHLAARLDIDFLGVVGMILLSGVVVNNGIVLIDYVNRLRHEGHARTEAILLATDRRFRPIMMTALTTIFGLVPLLFSGTSSIGLNYQSFGLVLIGGLTTATLLTLLVVPVFYTFFDDAREAFGWALRRALAARGGAPGTAPASPGPAPSPGAPAEES